MKLSKTLTKIMLRGIVLLVAFQCSFLPMRAGEVTPEQAKFFENKVRPLLAEHCFECHGADEAKGELRLDSLSDAMFGGESGKAVVPGNPDESLLIQAINYESFEMPPDEKLSPDQISILTRWIEIGAPWPGGNPDAPIRKRDQFEDEDKKWWAIQPLNSPAPPTPAAEHSQWAINEVDHFIAAKLSSEGLTPAPEATKREIVRRLYLNVIGLPPTVDQVAAFLNNESPTAYEELVDELLDSKGYGEHSARMWLDLVRYADSDGYRADEYRPDAFRYRDYVIRSFNADKPYDRFVQEQLAADELFPNDLDAQLGLGFLRHWVYEWNIRDARTQWKTILDDVTDTTADAFLGLGLQCAKCHNHKFDPLLQKDFFRLQAFLTPIMPKNVEFADAKQIAAFRERTKEWETKSAEIRQKIAVIEQPYRDKWRDIAIDRFPDDLKTIARKSDTEQTPHEKQLAYLVQRQVQWEYDRLDSYISAKDKEKLVELRREMKAFDALKPKPLPVAMVVSDVSSIAPDTVLPKQKNELVEPGIPSILDAEPMMIPSNASGQSTGRRAALARWITDPTNPLSTRVIVNRIWQSHFGRGLAANPSDFGTLGGPPSHPELLDWLARKLVENHWSLQSLHRIILLSATYRQSTAHPRFEEYNSIDPANDFYWRRDTTRLTAEQIRDSFLAVSGKLEDCQGGPGKLADSSCRTIYTRVMRNSPDEMLDSFDLPQFFSSNSNRNTTTTPIQSLLMFNSSRVYGYGRKLAEIINRQSSEPSEQIRLAWNRVYGREPNEIEIEASLKFISAQKLEVLSSESKSTDGLVETAKLPYRDGQSAKFEMGKTTLQLTIPHSPKMNVEDFTIEAFFQVRSIAQTGDVRTIVSKWTGGANPGWRFGVTGAGSRRKPQTLVLQMIGNKGSDSIEEAAIFSDQHIALNTPYYASASLQLARNGEPGKITFFLKDLSNDDEQLQSVEVVHDITGGLSNHLPLTIGSMGTKNAHPFDGLIDDVRFVGKTLDATEILHTVERELPEAIGYWQFETVPGLLQNTYGKDLTIIGRGSAVVNLTAEESALADFCHALLNSNEFLYQN